MYLGIVGMVNTILEYYHNSLFYNYICSIMLLYTRVDRYLLIKTKFNYIKPKHVSTMIL